MRLPNSRTTDIIENDLGNELLIYDSLIHKAYSLNKTLKIVYQSCDGKTSFEELKRKHQFTDDLIYLALDELKQNNLLIDYQSNYFKGLSRREVIRKVGLASLIALPIITGLAAPTAAMAQSAAACQSVSAPFDPNGIQGNGNACECNSGFGSDSFGACNTTRGGDGSNPTSGCRAGCLCKSSVSNAGVVLGTCG